MTGTGDIWSTAADLTRFTAALHTEGLVTDDSLHAMLTPHAAIEDDDETLLTTGYGYGMFTGTFAGHPAYYHPGDNPGYRSLAAWLPAPAASVIVLANDQGIDAIDVLRELLPAALDP
jgi:CubicO group peptidase (beta-lactamase class C family)